MRVAGNEADFEGGECPELARVLRFPVSPADGAVPRVWDIPFKWRGVWNFLK